MHSSHVLALVFLVSLAATSPACCVSTSSQRACEVKATYNHEEGTGSAEGPAKEETTLVERAKSEACGAACNMIDGGDFDACLAALRKNVEHLRLTDRCRVRRYDLGRGVGGLRSQGPFDLVLVHPPFERVPVTETHEKALRLQAGEALRADNLGSGNH